MKPHLRFAGGLWWCGPRRQGDYYLWACCDSTVRGVWQLWSRVRGCA